jgi:succinate-semialdehyde dehydrogenase/glutarate-semialdehyde dehydrogenase
VGSAEATIAIATTRRSVWGRRSSVATRGAREVADQLDVGMVRINTTVKSAPDLPFGGLKALGVGRELGRFGLDEFANKKLVRKLTI